MLDLISDPAWLESVNKVQTGIVASLILLLGVFATKKGKGNAAPPIQPAATPSPPPAQVTDAFVLREALGKINERLNYLTTRSDDGREADREQMDQLRAIRQDMAALLRTLERMERQDRTR